MTDHREEIGSLIRAQLEADDELDSDDVVTHWTVLVGLASADEDGVSGTARVIRSQRGMAIHTELGLLGERWMYVQAVMNDAHRRSQDEE